LLAPLFLGGELARSFLDVSADSCARTPKHARPTIAANATLPNCFVMILSFQVRVIVYSFEKRPDGRGGFYARWFGM